MTEDSDQPMGSGRRQLQGVLDVLVQQSKEEKAQEAVDDPAVEEAAKSLVELPNSIVTDEYPPVKKKARGSLSPRKRRRRKRKEHIPSPEGSDSDEGVNGERHIPHVMTLFDRRVDLARFSDATPLYVMCREWMRNKPDKNSRGAPLESENDNPDLEEKQSFPGPMPVEGSSSSFGVAGPHPPSSAEQYLDQVLQQQSSTMNGSAAADNSHDVDSLRQEHLQRWKSIRVRWKQSSLANQKRYSESLKMLRDMFQR